MISKNFNKHFCIVQLTRIGDLIQTYTVVKSLKKQFPNVKVTLVARAQFATPLLFLLDEVFDKIILLNFKNILARSLGLFEIKKNIHNFIEEINSKSFDIVINLTFSKSSSYLTSLIKAPICIGMRFDSQGQYEIKDSWSQYLYSSVMRGPLNPFNLVDLYKLIIGINLQVKSDNNDTNLKSEIKKIVIHPFASQKRKKWNVEKWKELIYSLLESVQNSEIHIVGGKTDLDEISIIMDGVLLKKFQKRIHNHVGEINLEEVHNLLKNSDLLIAHDSMVSHLSSLTSIKTLIISLGNARYFETAPYKENVIIVSPKSSCYPCFPDEKCPFLACHADISYTSIIQISKLLLEKENFYHEDLKKQVSHFHLAGINLFQTAFTEVGHLVCHRIDDHYFSLKEIFRLAYSISFLFVLKDKDYKTSIPAINQEIYNSLITELRGLGHLYELCEFAKKYSQTILHEISKADSDLNKIKETSKKIDEIDHLQSLVTKTSQMSSLLVDYYNSQKAYAAGENIVQIAESTYIIYDEFSSHVQILYQILELIMSEFKAQHSKTSSHHQN